MDHVVPDSQPRLRVNDQILLAGLLFVLLFAVLLIVFDLVFSVDLVVDKHGFLILLPFVVKEHHQIIRLRPHLRDMALQLPPVLLSP